MAGRTIEVTTRRGLTMKYLMKLSIAACLFGSLAFADNPTDAPLTFGDGNPPVAKKETDTGKHRRHNYKKEEQRALRAKGAAPSNGNRQPEQSSPGYPATVAN